MDSTTTRPVRRDRIDVSTIRDAARGRWTQILPALGGVDAGILDGRHHPCPRCGGTDRFRMIDAEAGACLCNQCFNTGNGDGIAALQWLTGDGFKPTIATLADHLGVAATNGNGRTPDPLDAQVQPMVMDEALIRQWCVAKPPITVDAARAAGARLVQWPARSHSRITCVAFDAYRDGIRTGVILYRADGQMFGAVLNGPGERKTHMLRGSRDGWIVIGDVAEATTIIKVEGVPDALAIHSHLPMDHAVITNICGAMAAAKLPLAMCAGKTVIVIGDTDLPGQAGAERFAQAALQDSAGVQMARLPYEVTDDSGRDVRDYIADGGSVDDLLASGDVLAASDPVVTDTDDVPRPDPPPTWTPFPTDVLPDPVGQYVNEAAAAIGCDPSFVALPILSALAGTIGNTRRIRLRRDWSEPAVVWTGIIGESGTQKTPALELPLRPLRRLELQAVREHEDSQDAYDRDCETHKADLADWRKSKARKKGEPPPDSPAAPIRRRRIVSDTTIEALAALLKENPRGLLLVRDELAGWLKSFDQYKGGKGGDAQHWLTLHSAGDLIVDRKTGAIRTMYVPHTAVSIAGGIQPEILRESLGREHFEDGLAARLLLAKPPRRPRRWTDAEIDPTTESALADLYERLAELEADIDDDGEPTPRLIGLTAVARDEFRRFVDRHGDEQTRHTGALAAAWSKLEGYAARLALIIHCVRTSAADTSPVDDASIRAGIALADWFGHEAVRVYGGLHADDKEWDRQKTVDLIEGRGRRITPRELTQYDRRFRNNPDGAKAHLQRLVDAGMGEWIDAPTSPQGGRPTRVFSLANGVYVYETPVNPAKNGGFVDTPPEIYSINPEADDSEEVMEWTG